MILLTNYYNSIMILIINYYNFTMVLLIKQLIKIINIKYHIVYETKFKKI